MNEIRIRGLSLDSRQVTTGDVFIALLGAQDDGYRYIQAAIHRGAVAVLVESLQNTDSQSTQYSVPVIEFPNLKDSLSYIAGRFFSEPSQQMQVIGITGTNGKTSCSNFIAQLLSSCGISCGVIGTLGSGFLNALRASECTTPDAIATQRQLAELQEKGAKAVAMEVSSHALCQKRVEGVRFHTIIFTNLTRDHLDYHEDMENYFTAKQRLFLEFNAQYLIVNLDDYYGRQLVRNISRAQPYSKIIGITTYPTLAAIPLVADEILENIELMLSGLLTTEALVLNTRGMQANIRTPWGRGELNCSLLGRFNLSNLLAALAAVCIQEIPFERAISAVNTVEAVPGRMMCLRIQNEKAQDSEPLVVIDYAHTPDAVLQVLKALREHCLGRLWCVFGCGGDRDRGKRSLMAEIAEQYSDYLVITQDNPRTEDPEIILHDILQGISNRKAVHIEPNRQKAIEWAVQNAAAQDIVLVAGKGHERYQIVGTTKIPFYDGEEALKALKGRVNDHFKIK